MRKYECVCNGLTPLHAVFDIPNWARKELTGQLKQFLWHHVSASEVSRHKTNMGLLVTPRQACGVGLASFDVAIKTQRAKHALKWLMQEMYEYYMA